MTRRYHHHREALGLPNVRWHCLRHAWATMLFEAGENLCAVSRVLGHASIATTASFHSHVRPSMLRRFADRMDEVPWTRLPVTSTGGRDSVPSSCSSPRAACRR